MARLRESEPRLEFFVGDLQESNAERRCAVSWEWPGDDGNLHTSAVTWQPGETFVRPLTWWRRRRPLPGPAPDSAIPPWPLTVVLDVRGSHGHLLERASIRARKMPTTAELLAHSGSAGTEYEVSWTAPWGQYRLPQTDLPCQLSSIAVAAGHHEPALLLAGLTLAWRIDLDREAWFLWRRLGGSELLRALGGGAGCPEHGMECPWPSKGTT
jgi:hypothetical protein